VKNGGTRAFEAGDTSGTQKGYMMGVALLANGRWVGATSGGYHADVRSAFLEFVDDFVTTDGLAKSNGALPGGCSWEADSRLKCTHAGAADEYGAEPGKCAGSKLVQHAITERQAITCLGEVLFWPSGAKTVTIWDNTPAVQRYTNGQFVPSCITCQHQIPPGFVTLAAAVAARVQEEADAAEARRIAAEQAERERLAENLAVFLAAFGGIKAAFVDLVDQSVNSNPGGDKQKKAIKAACETISTKELIGTDCWTAWLTEIYEEDHEADMPSAGALFTRVEKFVEFYEEKVATFEFDENGAEPGEEDA